MNPDLEILKAALISTGDANALARVREHADAIRTVLDDDDIDLSAEQLGNLDKHREWVGEVYAALGDDGESGEDSAVAQAIQEVRASEAAEIGEAFAALMELLAESRYDWKDRLKTIRYPDHDSAARASLLNDPSVLKAGDHGYQLLCHTGLTPSIIYEATRGLHLLFDRVVDSLEESRHRAPEAKWPRHATVFRVLAGESAAFIPYELVRVEIAGTPDMPEDAIDPLCSWLSDVVVFQPFLIEGYHYCAERGGFTKLAELNLDIPDDLIAQWSRLDRRIHARRLAVRPEAGSSRRSLNYSY